MLLFTPGNQYKPGGIPAPADHDEAFFINQTESIEQYNRLLDGFKKASAHTLRARASAEEPTYADYYGGAYIDDDTGKLVVLITDTAPAHVAQMDAMAGLRRQLWW